MDSNFIFIFKLQILFWGITKMAKIIMKLKKGNCKVFI